MLPIRLTLDLTHRTTHVFDKCASVAIREFAEPADRMTWLSIQNAAFFQQRPVPWTERHFDRELGRRAWWRPSSTWFAVLDELSEASDLRSAESRRIPVATITVEIKSPINADIHWLAVQPNAQRKGIGNILLQHAIKHCMDRRIQQLTAETQQGSGAERFYRAAGFTTASDQETQ